jgi:hypothetical protein
MNPLVLGELFSGLIGIGKELIVDKDKQIEYAFKLAELQSNMTEKMLTMQTTPWVDGAVKVIYAIKELVIPLLRPVFGIGAAIYGASHPNEMLWLHKELGVVGDGIVTTMFGSMPAWMYSRHKQKMKED